MLQLLQQMEAPAIAKKYYENPDLYIFDEFQTNIQKGRYALYTTNICDILCML